MFFWYGLLDRPDGSTVVVSDKELECGLNYCGMRAMQDEEQSNRNQQSAHCGTSLRSMGLSEKQPDPWSGSGSKQ